MKYIERQVEVAVHDPHAASERFDLSFMLALRCSRCEKSGWAERRYIREAIRVHIEDECPMRHVKADDPIYVRVFYPKQ